MIEILPGSMADYYTKEGEKIGELIGEKRGERIGEKRGRVEGRLETLKTILRKLLKERFGKLAPKIARRIRVCKDAEQLHAEVVRLGLGGMASPDELNLKKPVAFRTKAEVRTENAAE